MKQIKTTNIKKELKEILGKYKTYDDFARNKDDAYKYAKLFNLKICPYCNINYIYTVTKDNDKIIRPDFDHFEPKSEVPSKELDVDNIVPSCLICNERLKINKKFTNKTHLNPLEKDFDSIAEFCIDIKSPDYLNEENFDILLQKRINATDSNYNLVKENIKDFKLLERYAQHKDTVVDILKDLKYYHMAKVIEINTLINKDANIFTKHLINKVIEYKNIDINNVSLGKLKKDIASKYSK